MKKILFILGIGFIGLAAFWRWYMAAPYTYRIPKDWYFQISYLGAMAFADEQGKLPEKPYFIINKRDVKVLNWTPVRTEIEDRYTSYDVKTGEVTYETVSTFFLNPKTGQNLEYPNHPEAQGLYYVQPLNVQKKDYDFFHYEFIPMKFRFVGEEILDGIKVYVFEYHEKDVDITETYKGTVDYPGIIPPEGQRIYSQEMTFRYWVEPKTGELLKINEVSTGDYYHDMQTGANGGYVSNWSGEMTGETIKSRQQYVLKLLEMRRLHQVFLPSAFSLLGFGLLALALRKKQ